MFSVPHNLSAALRANAQKKNCYAASGSNFFEASFLFILRALGFTKMWYANAPIKAMLAPLGRSPFNRLAVVNRKKGGKNM